MAATVLIAEDELLIALDVMDELGLAGFEVIGPFAKTEQVLEYCRTHTPDCAVLDLRLADGESYAAADLLVDRNVPVIFHSGHASPAVLSRRYPQGKVCPKPAPSLQLAELVAEACRDRHASVT